MVPRSSAQPEAKLVVSNRSPDRHDNLPKMEIRCKELSVLVDTPATKTQELPSIASSVKSALHRLVFRMKYKRKFLLSRVNAVFEPGTLTLVLGQPGSGKSTLLKVLSGQLAMNKHVAVEGRSTLYNGLEWKSLLPKLPQLAAYVPQSDQHFSSLTVQETLEFAHACCGEPASTQLEQDLTSPALIRHSADEIIEQLGLKPCRDTKIGNDLSRGVSGGELRRVTTGEMGFGTKLATFMDEVTTGLDSATAFDIVYRQREIAKKQQKTVVMALLQPTPEVFELFDNILLLNNGEVVYHGPRKRVLPYFEQLGLLCPLDVDVADFLLDIATDQQRQYEVGRPGSVLSSRVPRLGSEFARHFRQSRTFHRTMRTLDGPWSSELLYIADQVLVTTPEFRHSLWSNSLTLLRRQMMITLRNKKFLCVRAIMAVLGGLIYGTTFYHVDLTNVQVTLGIVYQTAIFLSMGQASEIPTFIKAREVYYKQRRANFYRTGAFVIAYLMAALPVIVGECVVFGSLVYWMCGFVQEFGPFVLFLLSMTLSSVALSASFLALAALSPSLDVAQPLSTLSNILFSVFAGFVAPVARLGDYFSWLYWVNPVAWCVRSVMVDQYRSPKFDVCSYGGTNYCQHFDRTVGEYLLSQYDVPSERGWVWGGVVYLILFNFLFVVITTFILEHKRFDAASAGGAEIGSSKKKVSLRKKDPYQLQLEHQGPREEDGAGYYFKFASPGPVHSTNSTHAGVIDFHAVPPKFKPVALAFVDLSYSVTVKRESVHLLKGISGYALPGTMTALMGSSGAGKTTLMDVIAGRKTSGTVRGKVLLNGYPATGRAMRRCTGYCEQQDVHSDGSTVIEALMFSAMLRQDADVPTAAKVESVAECLDLLDLRSNADQLVRSLSQEQLKRLSIGVEVAARPSILFLDEPTSGLDARAAKGIMEGVRKVANTGRTIVCTIHQPSADVFFLFDSLLLLRRGGELVFFGQLVNKAPDHRECGHLIDYFEAVPGIPRLPEGQNPATWMLECVGAGVDGSDDDQATPNADFVQHFQRSSEYSSLMRELDQPGVGKPGPDRLLKIKFQAKQAASSRTQLWLLTRRFFTSYWRTPSYNLTRLVIALGLGVVFGLLLVGEDFGSYQGINSAVGVILMTTLYQGNISFNSVLPFTARERAAYYRERNSHTYGAVWYFVGGTLVEIPYALVIGLIFSVVFYPVVSLPSISTGLLCWIGVSLFVLVETFLGQFLVYTLPTLELATIGGVLVNSFFLLFSGFNPPAASIPGVYKWCYYISPHRYVLSVLVALLFGGCPPEESALPTPLTDSDLSTGCEALENAPLSLGDITVKGYIGQVYNIKYDDIGTHFVCILSYIVALRALTLFSLKYLNHQKR